MALYKKLTGQQWKEIKNFTKIKEQDVDANTYIAEVKFDRIFKIGLEELQERLRDKLSPEQLNQMAQQRGNFKQGDKAGSPQLKYQMSKTTEGWVISQIGF